MIKDLVFMKLCEAYELACLERDALRCAAQTDDEALLRAEEECRQPEAAAVAYIIEQQKHPGII
jgi:hypothetical protein|nr:MULTISPECIES: hypothetical protein [Sinorhizobium]